MCGSEGRPTCFLAEGGKGDADILGYPAPLHSVSVQALSHGNALQRYLISSGTCHFCTKGSCHTKISEACYESWA